MVYERNRAPEKPHGLPLILNLGCGQKTSPYCTNIDWSIHLIIKKSPLLNKLAGFFLSDHRKKLLENIDGEILVHDLSRGIPFSDCSVDVVFSSHVLEHIDRENVPTFLGEVFRVLKPAGIHRICVPDLEVLVRDYIQSLDESVVNRCHSREHDCHISNIYEQSVRREAYGTSRQNRLQRTFENLFLGDARKRGQTHQWMYDRVNLTALLLDNGFEDVATRECGESEIPRWAEIGLEYDTDGLEYKRKSLYVECKKPLL